MIGFTSSMPTGRPSDMAPPDAVRELSADTKQVRRVYDRIRQEITRNKVYRDLARLEMDYYTGNVVNGAFASDSFVATENRIGPLVDQVACRIAETRPTGSCVPVNNEEQERDAARQRDELIYSEFSRVKLYTEVNYLVTQAATTTGTAFIAVHWDPKAGTRYTPTPEDDALLAEYRRAVEVAQPDLCHLPPYLDGSYGDLFSGGIDVEPLDIHQIGYDPFVDTIARSSWAYRRYFPLREEAVARWPWAEKLLPPATAFDNPISAPDDGAKSSSVSTENTLIYLYYERKGPVWPNGAVIYLNQNGAVIDVVPELPFNTIPIFQVRDRPILRRGPGLGRVRDQIPLARELNNRRQRLKEQLDRAGGINILAPEGAMKEQSFLDESVAVYEYDNMRGRPEQFQLNPNPSQQMTINDTRAAMDQLGGFPEFVRGRMPSGISGRTIGLYDAQIASLLGQLARSLGAALEDLAAWTLEAWRAYAPPEAFIEVAGAGGNAASRAFSKKAITSTRWKIDEASMVPRNQGYLREQLMAAANVPLLTQAPPKVRRWFIKSLEFPNTNDMLKDTAPAATYARGVVSQLLREQWCWPDTSDADNESVIRDVVCDAKFGSLFDNASDKARAMVEQYLDWSEWVIGSMTKGGVPGYVLRQTMISLNGDWTKPPPPPGTVPGMQPPGGAPPPHAPPQQGPPVDAFGPDPAPSGEMPPNVPPELMAMMMAGNRSPQGQDNAPHFVTASQPQGPGTEG